MAPVINRACRISVLRIDNFDFVIADDFLSSPDEFITYAKELSGSSVRLMNRLGYELHPPTREFDERFPDFRRELAYLVNTTIGASVKDIYGLDDSYTNIGIYKGPLFNCVYKLPAFTPHVDPGHISSVVYLNTPGSCSGGTGIYRHLPTGKMHFIQPDYSLEHIEEKPLTKPLNYSAGEWELLHKFDMQHNRFIAFNSSVVHKIFFEPEGHPYEADLDQTRLTLNTFFVYSK